MGEKFVTPTLPLRLGLTVECRTGDTVYRYRLLWTEPL